jgi:hypothetical protein
MCQDVVRGTAERLIIGCYGIIESPLGLLVAGELSEKIATGRQRAALV